jgi:hypothetical protein
VRPPERFGATDAPTVSATAYVADHHVAPLLLDERSRARLVEQHRRLPLALPGRGGTPARAHGPELARVLDWLRSGPLEGKLVLVRCADCDGLRIARMSQAPSSLPAIVEQRCYDDPAEAEHAVFLRRVADFLALHAGTGGA